MVLENSILLKSSWKLLKVSLSQVTFLLISAYKSKLNQTTALYNLKLIGNIKSHHPLMLKIKIEIEQTVVPAILLLII